MHSDGMKNAFVHKFQTCSSLARTAEGITKTPSGPAPEPACHARLLGCAVPTRGAPASRAAPLPHGLLREPRAEYLAIRAVLMTGGGKRLHHFGKRLARFGKL